MIIKWGSDCVGNICVDFVYLHNGSTILERKWFKGPNADDGYPPNYLQSWVNNWRTQNIDI